MPQTKNITIKFGAKAEKKLRKLPLITIKKLQKQINFLRQDSNHPSLHIKKMQGYDNRWEARIDYHYRFVFTLEQERIKIIAIGPHDEGLGKK